VIHRDIKPDNLVVKGINLTDEAILEGTNVDDLNWKALKEKWHVTLVDFGFARALGPKDIGVDSGLKRELDESGRIASMKDSARRIESSGSIHDVLNESSSSARKRRTGSIGASRHVIRQLSALGHRDYAAPEVKNKVREVEAHQDEGVTCTLSGYVSDYAMVADAYSVGATIRHILTGVPPQESVDAVIANHNNPINKMARWVGKKVNKKSQNKPKKRYRPSTEIPGEAVYLIKEMTKADTASRMSVRDARLYPYIDDLFEEGIFKKEILKFLSFVQEKPAGNS
jgi:serine/threonine protein kinase